MRPRRSVFHLAFLFILTIPSALYAESTKIRTDQIDWTDPVEGDVSVTGSASANVLSSTTTVSAGTDLSAGGDVNVSGMYKVGGEQIDTSDLSDVASIGMLDENEDVVGTWRFPEGTTVDGFLKAKDGTGIGFRDDEPMLGLWVEDGGQVGVRTVSPGAALHVAGTPGGSLYGGSAEEALRVTGGDGGTGGTPPDGGDGGGVTITTGNGGEASDVYGGNGGEGGRLVVTTGSGGDGHGSGIGGNGGDIELTPGIGGSPYGTDGNVLIAKNGGRVGIGTTSPTEPLDVDGNVNCSGSYRVGGSQISTSNLSDGANVAHINANENISGTYTFPDGTKIDGSFKAVDTTGIGLKEDGGSLGLYVEDGGQVGIRTASPSGTLSVIGNAGASGNPGADAETVLVITGGDGGSGSQSGAAGGKGAPLNTISGNGGNGYFNSYASGGDGGDITITSGHGGNKGTAGGNIGRGGHINLITGAGGTGGLYGNVELAPNGGHVLVGTTTAPSAGGDPVLVFGDIGAQPTVGSNTAGIYADDVGGTVEMFAVDEAGNDTQLSSHNFELFDPPGDATLPFSFYAKNRYLGIEMAVDTYRMAQLVEQLSGEKLIYCRQLPEDERLDWDEHQQNLKDKRDAEISDWDIQAASAALEGSTLTTTRPEPYVKQDPPGWLKVRIHAAGKDSGK